MAMGGRQRTVLHRLLLAVACMLPFMVTGAFAELDDAVKRGRLALEDGFYTLADESFLSALSRAESGEVPATDVSATVHYMLLSHFTQNRFDSLKMDLGRFAAEGLLAADVDAYWRAMLCFQAEDWAGAIALLEYFTRDPGRSSVYAARAFRLKALAQFREGNTVAAVAGFAALDTFCTNAIESAYNRMDWGRMLVVSGETEKAQKVWAPLLTRSAALPAGLRSEVCYQAGRAHLITGAVETAESLLKPLAEDESLDETLRVNVMFALADARLRSADAVSGVGLLTRFIPSIRNSQLRKKAEAMQVFYLLAAGQLDEAIVNVRAFVGGNADDPLAASLQYRLGEALLRAARYSEADEVFQRYLEAFGDSTGIIYRGRGLALAGLTRNAEAALLFERAASLATDSEECDDNLFRAGDCYFLNKQFRKALEIYTRLLGSLAESAPLKSRVLFQCAASLAALGDTDSAIEKYDVVARTYPKSPEAANALLSIGDLYISGNHLDAAESAFEKAMTAYPEGPFFWRALHGRGMARYYRWAPDAIDDFVKIAAEAGDSSMMEHALFMQAMCLYRLGRDTQALAICGDFRKRFPGSEWAAPVHFWIARFEYNAGHDEIAEKEFLSFVETYPAHALAAQSLLRAGLAASRRQQYLQAIEYFGRMAKLYPQSDLLAEARFHQAEAMVQLGRFSAAILVYEEVINRYPDRDLAGMAWGRKGDCQFTLGSDDPARYGEAVQSYMAVLEMPALRLDYALQAACKLGLTYEKLGRMDDALEQYYSRVMLPFLVEKEKGGIPGEAARVWFSRAARGAADIAESRKEWRRLIRILERAASADVEFSAEAKTRIKAVKSEYWWMFY